MRIPWTVVLLATTVAADAVDFLSAIARFELSVIPRPRNRCNTRTAVVRKEWLQLSSQERKAYTAAVVCLTKKPSRTDRTEFPGVRSRYDDFVATHINQTRSIHATANFLIWHRYYVWAFEQALINECGYKGSQPYWNWGATAADPRNAKMFDGSDDSMGGDGEYVPHKGYTPGRGVVEIPAGQGGGCVTNGPFKNMTVTLGPVSPGMDGIVKAPDEGRGYNPRCLRRDISQFTSSRWSTVEEIMSLILKNKDIYWFQTMMQGDPPTGFLGVHAAGHFTISGDPAGDFYVSPGDPLFWLHHGMIDRVYWIWQNLDPRTRTMAISGTITIGNTPPSRNGTLDDIVDLGINAKGRKMRDLMSTIDGPFCYIYS